MQRRDVGPPLRKFLFIFVRTADAKNANKRGKIRGKKKSRRSRVKFPSTFRISEGLPVKLLSRRASSFREIEFTVQNRGKQIFKWCCYDFESCPLRRRTRMLFRLKCVHVWANGAVASRSECNGLHLWYRLHDGSPRMHLRTYANKRKRERERERERKRERDK